MRINTRKTGPAWSNAKRLADPLGQIQRIAAEKKQRGLDQAGDVIFVSRMFYASLIGQMMKKEMPVDINANHVIVNYYIIRPWPRRSK